MMMNRLARTNSTTITDSAQYIVLGGSGGTAAPPPPLLGAPKTRAGDLQQAANYPNPFGSASQFKTTIPFMTDGTGTAEITIMDATGKVVLTDDLVITDAGKHFFYFTGEQLPAGTYYYRIEFPKDERVIVQRAMILVK